MLDHFVRYSPRYVHRLLAGGLTPLVALQLALSVAAVARWLFDGAPIVADGWRWLRGRFRA